MDFFSFLSSKCKFRPARHKTQTEYGNFSLKNDYRGDRGFFDFLSVDKKAYNDPREIKGDLGDRKTSLIVCE